MSHSDKSRPYWVKRREYEEADPYSMKREAFIDWRPGLHGCNRPGCFVCGGWLKDENRKARRQGKREVRDWWKD